MKLKKRIKFFSFYGCREQGHRRNNSPAADTKIDYIISILNRLGYGVDLISRASSSELYFLPSSVNIKGENTYRYFASFGRTKSFFRIIFRWFIELQFFIWCIFNLDKGEQVIVYHSLGYSSTFIKLKKLKNIKIIGEIEEIYQDVHKQNKLRSLSEYKFIDICDKYIFPTSLMNELLNKSAKPFVVIHGIYSVEEKVVEKFEDNKIHVVYGGTLDPKKGGAVAAATAAAFLPEEYCVHICGFGDSTEIKKIIEKINKNQKKGFASLIYEGELRGDDYKYFIQKCDIGLSTQNPKEAFNSTSFPSKILVYLSNGLKVVSIRIPVIEQSALADSLFFYNKQDPKEIAKAIVHSCSICIDGRQKLEILDKCFEKDFDLMIKK